MKKVLVLAAVVANMLLAQSSLVLSNGAAIPGSVVTLNLAISHTDGARPAGLQWTFTYPVGAFTAFQVVPGPVMPAANKSLVCSAGAGTYQCIAYGMDSSAFGAGTLATVSAVLAPGAGTTSIGVIDTAAATVDGDLFPASGAGGVVTAIAPVTVSGLACSPASLTASQTSTCTVTLGQPAAAGGVSVALSSNSASLTVPAAVTVPANSSSATFTASAGAITSAQTAVITASVGASSRTAGISLVAPTSLSGISCTPSVLIAGRSGSCIVTLTSPAPADSDVTLSSTNPSFRIPASATVLKGTASVPFSFTTTSSLTGWVIVMASLGSSKKTFTLTSTTNTTPPAVIMIAPGAGTAVAGSVMVKASASGTVAVTGVQFTLDGASLGTELAAGGYVETAWNTTSVPNGMHTLGAVARNAAGITGTATIAVTVNNTVPPVISVVSSSAVTSSSATITWVTDKPSNSQVEYGTSTSYTQASALDAAMTLSHSVTVTGLTGATAYHYRVCSQDADSNETDSADYVFTTSAGAQTILLLHADQSEVSGTTDGSMVTPAVAPPGFTGKVAVNGSGSVNFTPGQNGDGVYFKNCCGNGNNALYKFAGTGLTNVFKPNQGTISFYLKSRASLAQRTAYTGYRTAFDVFDDSGHRFYFTSNATGGNLCFEYTVGGPVQSYCPAKGTEDALFGNGVILKVTITWDSTGVRLYLNNDLIKTSSLINFTPLWSANSVLNLGAYQISSYGAFNVNDDIIDEFTVLSRAEPPTGN